MKTYICTKYYSSEFLGIKVTILPGSEFTTTGNTYNGMIYLRGNFLQTIDGIEKVIKNDQIRLSIEKINEYFKPKYIVVLDKLLEINEK